MRFINDQAGTYLSLANVKVAQMLNESWRNAWTDFDEVAKRSEDVIKRVENRIMDAFRENKHTSETSPFSYSPTETMYFDDTITPLRLPKRLAQCLTEMNLAARGSPFVSHGPDVVDGAEIRERIVATVDTNWFVSERQAEASDDEDEIGEFAVVNSRDISKTVHEHQRSESEAAELAQMASRAKTRFLAHMSHDIRTPLAGIISSAQLLDVNSSGIPTDERILLKNILNSGQALMTLCNDILDITRIEQGGMSLRLGPTSLADCIESCAEMVKHSCVKKGLLIETKISPCTPEVILSDPDRLKQVLYNLLGNAVQYTNEGKVSVEVDTTSTQCSGKGSLCHLQRRAPDAGTPQEDRWFQMVDSLAGTPGRWVHLRIRVSDTGTGIPESRREEIFQAFSQGSEASRFIDKGLGIGPGSGLGLKIALELTALLKGHISLQSEEGEGSTFTVEMCSQEFHPDAKEEGASRHPGRMGGGAATHSVCWESESDISKLDILIAEDNAVMQMITQRFLEKFHVRSIETVDDGAKAMEAVGRKVFSVLIIDWHMPVKDGLEVIKEVRSFEEARTTTGDRVRPVFIIVTTADALTGTAKHFKEVGADAFLSKPIEVPLLKEALERAAKHAAGCGPTRGI